VLEPPEPSDAFIGWLTADELFSNLCFVERFIANVG
jgi:hypothetical protein